MEEILVRYTDLSDPYFPKVREGFFYVNYKPTRYASAYDRIRAFTADGHPVILHGLRYDWDTDENFARVVEFLKRPSIFTYNHNDPEPEPVQAAAPPPTPQQQQPSELETQYVWPDSYCWRDLGISREKLPEDRVAAQDFVERQFRDLVMRMHPDRGGDGQNFRRVLVARKEARRILSSLVRA